jgi:DNA invertase Pin-like site-specific DNA recombinase
MVSSIGWRLVDVFQDPGSSSENLARPEMQRLMACAEIGQFEHVVVYAVDRLTRRLFDFARLIELFDKSGVKLTVVTDPHFGESAASRLSSNIVAAASEFQQDLTKERMAETRAAMKAKGMRVAGRIPSLSNTATRSEGATNSGEPSLVTFSTKAIMARFGAVSCHEGSASCARTNCVALSTKATERASIMWCINLVSN